MDLQKIEKNNAKYYLWNSQHYEMLKFKIRTYLKLEISTDIMQKAP